MFFGETQTDWSSRNSNPNAKDPMGWLHDVRYKVEILQSEEIGGSTTG